MTVLSIPKKEPRHEAHYIFYFNDRTFKRSYRGPETYVNDGAHTYPRFSYSHFSYSTAVVKRTDFNMGKYAPNVDDDVTLTLSVEAIKE